MSMAGLALADGSRNPKPPLLLQVLNCTVEWGRLGQRDSWRQAPTSILQRLLTALLGGTRLPSSGQVLASTASRAEVVQISGVLASDTLAAQLTDAEVAGQLSGRPSRCRHLALGCSCRGSAHIQCSETRSGDALGSAEVNGYSVAGRRRGHKSYQQPVIVGTPRPPYKDGAPNLAGSNRLDPGSSQWYGGCVAKAQHESGVIDVEQSVACSSATNADESLPSSTKLLCDVVSPQRQLVHSGSLAHNER